MNILIYLIIAQGNSEDSFNSKTAWIDNKPFITIGPGSYILRSKVYWNEGGSNEAVLSSYSDVPIDITPVKNKQIYKSFLEKWFLEPTPECKLKKTKEDCQYGSEWLNLSLYGLYAENNGNRTFKLTIDFKELTGLKLGKLHKTSDTQIKLVVPPKQKMSAYLKTFGTTFSLSTSYRMEWT